MCSPENNLHCFFRTRTFQIDQQFLKGTVSGILNFVGVIPFFLIPALVGFSTKYERSMAQWRYVYYGTIVVVLITTLVYVVCGTSDPQEWGTYDEEPIEEETADLTKKEKSEDQP
ncbi:sialin [Trichonephila clavata]|uniref:Sialin n=1 Tax=Trichonephila clavata TaxID=2740835 RepID=A0A8X6K9R7_TRICU|nr:sialin [Trichonephila clavata]